jgi:hypothetical protein
LLDDDLLGQNRLLSIVKTHGFNNKNSCVWLGYFKVIDFINIHFLIAAHMLSLDSNPHNSSVIHLISKCNYCSTNASVRTARKKINALQILIMKAGVVFLV